MLSIINRLQSSLEKTNKPLNLADRLVVVETYQAFLRSNHFIVLIFFLVWACATFFQIGEVQAQISPEGRDRTYKQAAPHRFDRRFGKQPSPKSMVIPLKPESAKPEFPKELDKVKFVLNDLLIKGTTVYDKRNFLSLYRKFLKKELSLKHIY